MTPHHSANERLTTLPARCCVGICRGTDEPEHGCQPGCHFPVCGTARGGVVGGHDHRGHVDGAERFVRASPYVRGTLLARDVMRLSTVLSVPS
jgi:hypothetical protein